MIFNGGTQISFENKLADFPNRTPRTPGPNFLLEPKAKRRVDADARPKRAATRRFIKTGENGRPTSGKNAEVGARTNVDSTPTESAKTGTREERRSTRGGLFGIIVSDDDKRNLRASLASLRERRLQKRTVVDGRETPR